MGGDLFFAEIVPPGGKSTIPGGVFFLFMFPGGKTPCECFQAEMMEVVGGKPRLLRYYYCSCFPSVWSGGVFRFCAAVFCVLMFLFFWINNSVELKNETPK